MSQDQESLPAAETIAPPVAPARRRGLWFVAMLALLLAAAALAFDAWQWYRQQTAATVAPDDTDDTGERLATLEELVRRAPDQRIGEALRDMEQDRARLSGLDARVDALETQGEALARRVAGLGSADRQDWVLAQAEYLERLASQSLLAGREVRSALGLLTAADDVLRGLDDPALYAARAALARDIARLREIAEFDVEGTYARLAALAGRVSALTVLRRTAPPAFDTATEEAAPMATGERWWSRAAALLGRFVVVRHRSESVRPLLPLGEEGRLRMELRLGIEQAKLALLAAEPRIYRDALGMVRTLAADTLTMDDRATHAFLSELDALAAIDIAPALPDITDSLRALRASVPAVAGHDAAAATLTAPPATTEPPATTAPPATTETPPAEALPPAVGEP